MDQKLIFPIVMGTFVLLMIARRVRRNVGRQPVRPGPMQLRIGLFSIVGVVLALRAVSNVTLLGALLAGAAAGTALAWYGLQHTRFEKTAEGNFYTPHAYIGLAVSVLLIARLAYRFAVVYPSMHAAAQADQNLFTAYQRSPLTLALFGVLVGYYIIYYAGVLRAIRNP